MKDGRLFEIKTDTSIKKAILSLDGYPLSSHFIQFNIFLYEL